MGFGRVSQLCIGVVLVLIAVYNETTHGAIALTVIAAALGVANVGCAFMASGTRKESGPDEW